MLYYREALVAEYVENYNSLLALYRLDPEISTSHLELKLEYVLSRYIFFYTILYIFPPQWQTNFKLFFRTQQPKSKHVRFRDNLVEVSDGIPISQPSKTLKNSTPKSSIKNSPTSSTTAEDIRNSLFSAPYKDDPDEASLDRYRDDVDGSSNKNKLPHVDTMNNQHLHQAQLLQLQEQDSHLDRLAKSVSRQHHLGLQIHEELEDHVQLLDEMDVLTDSSQTRLSLAKQRLTTFSRKAKDNGSILTIVILFLTLIILLIVLK